MAQLPSNVLEGQGPVTCFNSVRWATSTVASQLVTLNGPPQITLWSWLNGGPTMGWCY